ncbi:recombinase family protein [Paraclostridium sordellii]|uniref:recombinase family protein n=1 Tax=Paraclostridium sordellii TaxID=1505 RepID=UPI0005E2C8DB|nr:recombinase family protein [Paeniclostridium sordellii]CEN26827.1 DNA recombinase [[Clostridium] sordellii] [Paeniclostridium sordellii]
MKKNVCLMRVSTDMQETVSQKTAIEKYAKDNKIVIHEYIEEGGVSGFKTKLEDRVGLMKIKQMALENKIDTLIVFNSDRIGRRMELVGFISLLDECDVKILSVTEGCLNKGEDTDSLISSIKMWMAEYESKKISERVKSGKKATALRGEFLGGVPNFGYKLGDRRLEVNKEESEVVKILFNTYIKNGSVGVLDLFEEKGITKRGDKWTRGKIIKTLKNTIYIGKKPLSDGEIPYDEKLRIVSDEVFYKAQEVMKMRTTKIKGNTTKFVNKSNALLEGIVFHRCPDGNIRRLHIDYNSGTFKEPEKKKLLYRCSYCKSRRYKDVQKTYGGIKLNNKIEEMIISIMTNTSYEELEKEFKEFKNENTKEIESQTEILKNKLDKKKVAIDKATKELEKIFMGESNMDKETINSMIIKLKDEVREIEENLIILKNETQNIKIRNMNTYTILEKYKNFEFLYNKATLEEKKIILQEIINKVIVSEDDIEISLNI